MRPQTGPRSQCRRSSCPSIIWVLLLAWAVLFVATNIARVLMLPGIFERVPEPAKTAPTYYDYLGVTPKVNDTTLRQMRKSYRRELHPDKTGGDLLAKGVLTTLEEVFDTLLDGRLRCEYDKRYRIRGGLWPLKNCEEHFPEEYWELRRERARVNLERRIAEWEAAREKKEEEAKVEKVVVVEEHKAEVVMPPTGKEKKGSGGTGTSPVRVPPPPPPPEREATGTVVHTAVSTVTDGLTRTVETFVYMAVWVSYTLSNTSVRLASWLWTPFAQG